MKTVEISYNPYKMITKMLIDGIDVCNDNHYDRFGEFVKNEIPLQIWIEPILYRNWQGFVNEISDVETNDEVTVIFSGRVIDFEDLKRSIANQNQSRSETTRVKYHFQHKKVLDDKVLSKNIEQVVGELKSDRFKSLVHQRTTAGLTEKYNALDENYTIAKQSEFYIVLAGVYSSGKSTLLNTLIRHDILPTSSRTCTSKNCRIRHDRSLGNRVALSCYNEKNELVGERRIFENDVDCANAFLEICPIADGGIDDINSEIVMMEVGADLSHLYPDSVTDDKFTIVLIDTPGMDSAKSSEDGKNRHAEIALEAITMKSKPMVVLCVDANKYEDNSIGEFMKEIIEQTEQEGSGFNDRFLFLMNKSDTLPYRQDETPDGAKETFAQYLTDVSKWSISSDEEQLHELAEGASHFVPRIFMTAAAPAFAITSKIAEIPKKDVDDDHWPIRKAFESFKDEVIDGRHPEKYYLSGYCDIPNYRKDEIKALFDKAIDDRDDVAATGLQCGMVAVESAIKDYIERYAYPIKVRALLDTFEDILEDVNSFTNGILADLKQAEKDLGERKSERKEAGVIKKGAKGKIAALEKAKKTIDDQLEELDETVFDSYTLKRAISNFRADIEESKEFSFIRQNPKVMTGQKTHSQVETEITELIMGIRAVFDDALLKTNDTLMYLKEKYDGQLEFIFDVLTHTIRQLEKSGVFEKGEYKFTDSVLWKVDFANINTAKLTMDIKKNVVDKTSKTKKVRNAKKDDWSSSWNPFKKIGSLFMDDYITETVYVDGYYKTDELKTNIEEYMSELHEESNNMERSFKYVMDESKIKVRTLIKRLIKELNIFLMDISYQEHRIEQLSNSMDDLKAEISKNRNIHIWLRELKNKLEEE